MVRFPLRFVAITTVFAIGLQPAFSQQPNQLFDALQDNLQNQRNAEAEAERMRRDRQRAASDQRFDGAPQELSLDVKPGGPCFKIRSVKLTGHEAFKKLPEGYQSLVGQCASAADIAGAVNRINQFYQQKGFITTRAYLPEQDISAGDLEIVIVPGKVEGFVYGDGRQADSRIKAAFPNERGDLLNLRDLEQGLDNYNAPASAKAKFQLIPGEHTGGSFVQVLAEDSRRVFARLSANNDGFKSTGVVKTTGTIGVDNMLGLNDQISLSGTTTPFDKRATRYSDSLALSGRLPYGNWSFGFDAGVSRYHFILGGINQSYPVDGHSGHVSFSAERLLMRDARSKYFAYGDLRLSRSRSFIDDYEIESQRRHLTIATLGLRGEHTFDQSRFDWDFGSKLGIRAFNSYVYEKSQIETDFKLLFARLNYKQPLISDKLTHKASFSAQWSNDELPSSEYFSVGGWSNVRGFHDDNMYGASGAYLRNTLEWDAYQNKHLSLRLRSGLDIGYVQPTKLRTWDQKHLIGGSLGADIDFRNGPRLSLDIAHALDRPSDFDGAKTVYYANFGVKF